MYISRKQRALIKTKVHPACVLTSNYLGTDLQKLLQYHSEYFARRYHPIRHFLPEHKNFRHPIWLTILFNAYIKRFGYAKKLRPKNWIFYGNLLLTRYGHKKQRKERKRKRERERERKRRERQSKRRNRSEKPVFNETLNETHKKTDKDCTIVLESSSSNSVEQSLENNCENQHVETTVAENHNQNDDTVTRELPKEISDSDKNTSNEKDSADDGDDEFGDETVDNIWNLDIQEVAALITESGNDENQLIEGINHCFAILLTSCVELFLQFFFCLFHANFSSR